MEVEEIQPWWFMTEPLEGESISHYLGRFRRANELSISQLGKISGLGAVIGRWEKFRFNPPPNREQLESLAKVIGIDADRLEQMLPPKGIGMNLSPIRLCAACYVENPCHQIEWQFKQTDRCHKHQLRLLSECPNCKARFQIPAMWIDPWCHRCFLFFVFCRDEEVTKSCIKPVLKVILILLMPLYQAHPVVLRSHWRSN